ncbi:MacB family efflux pump subunit [Breznakiella homolactica]|uniref:Pyoverdine export ATP-binding/permease protein PvdT n=1 Tax=Breznakiella homolactica TaxID=2798577 RepID=A0A7T7XLE2_9SPIR|nr:MacB family efflux pump subunit [Breznakiella homolactica]QQO08521.1 MacB family efflux pump subunit [Breznakiella homolactica]
MNIIELQKINKFFGKGSNQVHILKDINLSVEKGDFVAIIGQSGSGKSTMMNIIGCLDVPTSGSYKINGVEAGAMDKNQLAELRCKTFGFIFQRYNLLSNLKARENAALPAVYSGQNSEVRTKRAVELLQSLNLGDRLDNKPNALSGGQQQRVSIARALMNGGEIILADEPTGALDSGSGEKVMGIIKDLHRQGHTIILVTHDSKIASQASRQIEIKDGQIISDERKSSDIYEMKDRVPPIKRSRKDMIKYRFLESFTMSIQAIISNKMRSLLTMLGIIIGIASVVSVVALGNASQEKIMAEISSMGTNTIQIMPGTGFGDMRSGKIKTLKASDSDQLGKLSFIENATPTVSANGTLVYESNSLSAQLSGVGAEYFDVMGKKIAQGRIFSHDEVDRIASVVVIDDNTRKQIFSNTPNPVGSIIMFNKKPLEIIGVTEKEDSFGPAGNSMTLWTPYKTAMYKINGSEDINAIVVKVSDSVNSQVAEEGIEMILTALHGKKDFFMINSDSIKQTIESTTNIMKLLIASIAVISLIVGGIGVMNIMLVSVTERTREIGIRMAIGAKQMDILQQFLIEAILICIVGGIMGIALALLIGLGFNTFSESFGMDFSIPSIVLALVSSTGIGIVFGYMPAKNASNLNPIDALASE